MLMIVNVSDWFQTLSIQDSHGAGREDGVTAKVLM